MKEFLGRGMFCVWWGGRGGRGIRTGTAEAFGYEDAVEKGADGPANEAHGEGVGILTVCSELHAATLGLLLGVGTG